MMGTQNQSALFVLGLFSFCQGQSPLSTILQRVRPAQPEPVDRTIMSPAMSPAIAQTIDQLWLRPRNG